MRVSFMQRVDGPDANSAFQRIKVEKGMRQFMRILVPPSAGHGTGPSGFASDILRYEHRDEKTPAGKLCREKIEGWSRAHHEYIKKSFERLHGTDGVCGVVQVFDVDSGAMEDTWLFFGWSNVEAMENAA